MKIREVKIVIIPYIDGFGMQKHNPAYRNYTLDRIEQEAREYEPYGYNFAVFCRDTATIHIYTVTQEYLEADLMEEMESELKEWAFIFGWEKLKNTVRMLEENEAEEQGTRILEHKFTSYWEGM